ncbi:MAG: RsmE family RNA methyltransferase [Erysipelotrichaceae bacterium]
MHQYFVDNLTQGISYLSCDQAHHLLRVLRNKVGDKLRIVYEGQPFLAEIIEINPKVKLKIIESLNSINNHIFIRLLPALIKKDKWEWLIMKACEFGVSEIQPLVSDNCVVKISDDDDNKIARWNKIALSACQQCKRAEVVLVRQPVTLKEIGNYPAQLLIVAYEKENIDSSLKKLLQNNNFNSVNIVIGPEGGLSSSEHEYLTSLGYHSVSLGSRILRAESASIFVLNCLDYEVNHA